MKKIIIAAVFGAAVIAAPAANAVPALCSSHAEHGGQPFGNGPDTTYVTACGGGSGPDSWNNAIAPSVDTTAS